MAKWPGSQVPLKDLEVPFLPGAHVAEAVSEGLTPTDFLQNMGMIW